MKSYSLFGALALLWIFTMGIVVERPTTSTFSTGKVDPWCEFELGDLRLYPNTWVDSEHVSSSGLFSIFYWAEDVPPYTLSMAFTASESERCERLVIQQIQIDYLDGGTSQVAIPADGIEAELELDDRDIKRFRRANFDFPGAISKHGAFHATINGYLDGKAGREDYSQRISVSVSHKTYVYPGWIAIVFRNF